MKQKLHKEFCEIEGCGETDASVFHHHHIVERKEVGTSNHPMNLAVICSNCHNRVHAGKIKIIGVYPSTAKYGRTLIYELDGIVNVPEIAEAYFKYKAPSMKITYKENDGEGASRR